MHFITESESVFTMNPNPDSIIDYPLKYWNLPEIHVDVGLFGATFEDAVELE